MEIQRLTGFSSLLILAAKCFKVWLMEHAKLLPHYPVLENKLILRYNYMESGMRLIVQILEKSNGMGLGMSMVGLDSTEC